MFWNEFKKPFFALAPMHEVTDFAFRETISHFKKPDLIFTEFVSVDGLCHPQSREKMAKYYLQYSQIQRPIVAQIWGSNPEHFLEAAKYIASLGFDGIDINMGCPDKSVVKQGGGAALILNPQGAKEIIKATKEGANNLPVSVKTRIGFNEIETELWMKELIEAKPAAITVHGRTKKELSRFPVHWDQIALASSMAKNTKIKIIGNGDVLSLNEGKELSKKYNLDGIMVGRATMGNPWFFDENVEYKDISVEQKIKAMLFHAEVFENSFLGIKRFNHFKKHIKAYISGFKNAVLIRNKFMLANNFEEMKSIADLLSM